MRSHTFTRPLAVAVLLAVSSPVATAQSVTYDFSAVNGGFTSVNLGSGSLWSYGSTPSGPEAAAWTINGGTQGQFALTSPGHVLTVTQAGSVAGTLTHMFNFGTQPQGEGAIAFDGGQLQYRLTGNPNWTTIDVSQFGIFSGYNAVIQSGGNNPLDGQFAFTGKSDAFGVPQYSTSTFTLGNSTIGLPTTFQVGDKIEFRFLAGFAGDPDFSNTDVNWQLGSLELNDASVVPVPEPAGAVALAALAFAGFHLRRVTSRAASCRTTAS